MKKTILISLFALFLFGCGNSTKQQNAVAEDQQVVSLTVDDLYTKASDLEDKEVTVKGTVIHVCKQGGGRCFLMGSSEDVQIRVEAGEKIGAFNQEQMGSELEITGVLKMVKTEADAHNPGQEHGNEQAETTEDEETARIHKVIAEAQEASEVVYFIEGVKVKEL